jgi:hypothetical protein
LTELDLGALGLDRGGHLLLQKALREAPAGARLRVSGSDPSLDVHLSAWARARGHRLESARVLVAGSGHSRWSGAERAGGVGPAGVVDLPSARWGLAARGASVEAGSPSFDFPLADRDIVWTDDAARLYAQAAAAQWDPETAIDWRAPIEHPDEVEDAIVTVFTYLVENETAALLVPARFLAQIHPHFREILQVLAIQIADEARHIEVFVRRASLRRPQLGLSTHGGQASLKTLIDEPDFALAAFLLSVLGEGTFVELLRFLAQVGPDPVTRTVARLAAQDEARHVAFGMAHLERHASLDPGLRPRLVAAVHRRHGALQHTAGLNEEVFDALVLLAAGSWAPERLAAGWDAVQGLMERMDKTRRARMERLGFETEQAAALSALHTRNFM